LLLDLLVLLFATKLSKKPIKSLVYLAIFAWIDYELVLQYYQLLIAIKEVLLLVLILVGCTYLFFNKKIIKRVCNSEYVKDIHIINQHLKSEFALVNAFLE